MTVKCTRCGATVPADALDNSNHCLDWRCPVASREARLARARVIGAQADFLAGRLARQEERLAAAHRDAAA